MEKITSFKFYIAFILTIMLFHGCATYELQVSEDKKGQVFPEDKKIRHSFFLIGNTAYVGQSENPDLLDKLNLSLTAAPKESTLLFLGNSVANEETIKTGYLNQQLEKLKEFKGNTIFIPGELEWKESINNLEAIEDALDYKLGKNSFLPENGCPVDDIEISEDITLIIVDSQWYLSSWDNYPKINDNCEIKDRESFFLEIEDLVKDNVGKTLLIAVYHPMFSNGHNGGQYSLGQSLSPLPLLGTGKNILKKTVGFSTNSLQNSEYRTFRNKITTLAQYNSKVVFLSGNEASLQYLFDKNVHQIISGSGSNSSAVRTVGAGKFGLGQQGYVRLDVFADGSSFVRFFSAKDNDMVFGSEVLSADIALNTTSYKKDFPATVVASIYDSLQTEKSAVHKFLWGDRYRRYYASKVTAPTVDLDTLFGGLTLVQKGGGHQSLSLRLENREGKQYVMRALEKSAEAYLQFIVKEEYIIGSTEGSAPNRILKDFYTGDHPYAPFTIGNLADAVDIYHTNPVLYYVPKQNALGVYAEEFGDKLYMIEERAGDGHGDQESFGYSNTMISTADLIENLLSDEKYKVDTDTYIRARLFDMLIGDWDRHNDQWRWAEFKDEKTGTILYKPVPRDRDQVFSIMGDGFLMGFATRAIPSLKLMEGFDKNIRSVKGFNSSPKTFSLDKYILPETTQEQWIEQAKFIQQHINEDIIDRAFMNFPTEVQDQTVTGIKEVLLSRKDKIIETALEYYGIINKRTVVVGTNKDDYFVIEDIGDDFTQVTGYRIKNGKKGAIFFNKKIDKKITKDIWIYGLDDDDYFEVIGGKERGPKLKLIGGQNNDTYNVKNRRRTKIYDYKSLKSTFIGNDGTKRLTDVYNINTYDPFKAKNSFNQLIPNLGANPDDGVKIAMYDTYTVNGFVQEPFTSRHKFDAGFYLSTRGFDLAYTGEFPRTLGSASLELAAKYTSPNFSINFFGLGNETPNFDGDLDFDYNRVKMEILKFSPSLVWSGRFGSQFKVGLSYENIELEETNGRFVEEFYRANPNLDNENSFVGISSKYSFENFTGGSFPTLGLGMSIQAGYKAYLGGHTDKDGFGYVISSLVVDYKLVPSGVFVLASKLKGHVNLGNDFEFYQGASIGAEDGLRGYRFQRFTGKSAFSQSTDLRVSLKTIKTSFIPLTIGIYGGFDYGRVWLSDDNSDTWNNSYGGGIFVNGLNFITARASAFNSDDGLRFAIALGMGF